MITFVNRKNNYIEYLRGLACLIVFVGHVRVGTAYFADSRFDFVQIFTAWAKEAVFAFFILSGIVINISSKTHSSQSQYFGKRLIRIIPIHYLVSIFVIGLDIFILNLEIPTLDLLGNFLFFNSYDGYISYTLPNDIVVWSLSCEVFFYLIFGICINNKHIGLKFWLIASIISIVFHTMFYYTNSGILNHFINLLNLSIIWLLGYYLYEYKDKFRVNFPVAMMGVLMVPLVTRLHSLSANFENYKWYLESILLIPIFLYSLNYSKSSKDTPIKIKHIYLFLVYLLLLVPFYYFSLSTYLSKLIYLFLPFLSLLLYVPQIKALSKIIFQNSLNFVSNIAKLSYPLYLVHLPIMIFISHYIPNNLILGCALICILTYMSSYILEILFQEKIINPYFRK